MNNTLAECPVTCLQHEGELQEFLEIYKELKPKKVLEIGSFFGGTLWFFIKNNPNLEKLVVVDLPIPPSDARHEEMVNSVLQWQSWFPENLEFKSYSGNSQSNDLLINVHSQNEPDFDMLHIDADHTYNGVRLDYVNYCNLVKPGGIIVFHDVGHIPDVTRFWNEITANNNYKHQTIFHESGCGIGILYKKP